MIGRTRFDILAVVLCLFLAATTGAAARQQTDSVPVFVELDNSLCGVKVLATEGTFGKWEWDGYSWARAGVQYEHTFEAYLDPMPYGGCNLTVSFAGLANSSGDTIGAGHFSAEYPAGVAVTNPALWNLTGVTDTKAIFYYGLDSVPSTVPPGRYEGEMTVTVSNAA